VRVCVCVCVCVRDCALYFYRNTATDERIVAGKDLLDFSITFPTFMNYSIILMALSD
jgi:hypothetical protein